MKNTGFGSHVAFWLHRWCCRYICYRSWQLVGSCFCSWKKWGACKSGKLHSMQALYFLRMYFSSPSPPILYVSNECPGIVLQEPDFPEIFYPWHLWPESVLVLVICRLEYMHSKGIAYRDLKPENTLIGENGYPKLIDMGFAKRIHNRRTFSMCGTPDYMAPEIIKRQGHGKGVDFWALGCMIFEMITNTSPFNRGDDPPQVNISSTKYWAFVREWKVPHF